MMISYIILLAFFVFRMRSAQKDYKNTLARADRSKSFGHHDAEEQQAELDRKRQMFYSWQTFMYLTIGALVLSLVTHLIHAFAIVQFGYTLFFIFVVIRHFASINSDQDLYAYRLSRYFWNRKHHFVHNNSQDGTLKTAVRNKAQEVARQTTTRVRSTGFLQGGNTKEYAAESLTLDAAEARKEYRRLSDLWYNRHLDTKSGFRNVDDPIFGSLVDAMGKASAKIDSDPEHAHAELRVFASALYRAEKYDDYLRSAQD